MANVGTSTVAFATQQPTGSLVFLASDGTACVLWCDGTNQLFSYAAPPYSSWTTTTLVTGLNMVLGGRFQAGSDNINVVTGASTTVRPTYYPLTKVAATWTLGTAVQISTTAAGTASVGNVMQYAGQDPQGRHWIVCGAASTYLASRGLFSPANNPAGAWTSNISTTQTGDVNLPAGDQVGNYLLKTYWNGTAIQYHRLDTSVASLGAWSTAATIPNLTGSPGATSRVTLRAVSATQGLLVYSTGSGIYAQTYTPGTDTWSAATQLSTNASDRHPTIAIDGLGHAWVFWCSFAASNSYALVYKKWNGSTWDTSATTLVASGTNIANPSVGWGNGMLGATYTVGTANPFTVGWATVTITSTRTIPASAALMQTQVRTVPASCALLSTVTGHLPYATIIKSHAPLAYWRMAEASGTVATDASGNGKTATLAGVTAYSAAGAIARDSDTSLTFTAAGGLTFPSSLNVTTMTTLGLEFWIELAGVWEYIGVDTDGSTTTLYRNGTLWPPESSGSVGVAQDFSWAGSATAGNLDDIAVYPRLTASMALADYLAGSVPFLAVPSSTPLSLTKTRTVPASATLSGGSRAIPVTAAIQITSTRTVGSSTALLSTLTRNAAASSALLQTRTRPLGTSGALLVTSTRTAGVSSALLGTSARALSIAGALLSTAIRTVPASGVVLSQASRSMTASGALSISRIVPVSSALLLASSRGVPASLALQSTSTRTLGSTSALLNTRSRTLTTSCALVASYARNSGASVALLGQASRQISADTALSLTGIITRSIPATGALIATSSRALPASGVLGLSNVSRTVPVTGAFLQPASRSLGVSAAIQVTISRQIPVTIALLQPASRSLGTSTALLATFNRTVPGQAAMLSTQARAIPSSGALSALRTLSSSAALLATSNRVIPTSGTLSALRTLSTSAALFLTNTRSMPETTALFSTALLRTIPASTGLLATGTRTAGESAVLSATLTRTLSSSGSLSALRSIPVSTALLSPKNRTLGATVALSLVGTNIRTIPTSTALSLAVRTVGSSAALLGTLARAASLAGALSLSQTRALPCSVAFGRTASRTMAESAALMQPIVRVVPCLVALVSTQTRGFVVVASLSGGTVRVVSASAALMSTRGRTITTTVVFSRAGPNAVVWVRSGTAQVTVKSGNASIIVNS